MNNPEFNSISDTSHLEIGVYRSEEIISVDPLDMLDIQERLTATGEELYYSAEASLIHRQALEVPLQSNHRQGAPKLTFESIETNESRSHHTRITVPGITLRNDSSEIEDPTQTNTWQKFTNKGEFAGFLDRDELIVDLCTVLPDATFLRILLDKVNVTDKMVIDSLWNDTQRATEGWEETRIWNTINAAEESTPVHARDKVILIENADATTESSISLISTPSKRTFTAVQRQVVDSVYRGSGDNDEFYHIDPFSGAEGDVNLGRDMTFETQIQNTDSDDIEPSSVARLALRSPNMSRGGLEILNMYESRKLSDDNLPYKIYNDAINAVADAHLAPKLSTGE